MCDLHGLTRPEASGAIDKFLRESAEQNFERVRIITGKGIHSQGDGVLKIFVENLLAERGLEHGDSKINDGGAGAIDVKLKQVVRL